MKKRNEIKQLGMQKEFNNWLLDIKKRSTGFVVGSRVKLVEKIPVFSNIEIGTEGTITDIYVISGDADNTFAVDFDKYGTHHCYKRNRFRLI